MRSARRRRGPLLRLLGPPLSAIVLLGCSASASRTSPTLVTAADPLRYSVTFYAGAATIDVEVTSGKSLEGPWSFKRASGVVSTVRVEGGGHDRGIDVQDGAFVVPRGTERLRWSYDLRRATEDFGDSFQSGAGAGGSWVLRGEAYLARPDDLSASRSVELEFEGGAPLVPWELSDDGAAHASGRDLSSPGFHTFGGRRHTIRREGRVLEVAILDSAFAVSDEQLIAWLDQAAREVLTVSDRLPFPRAAVTVIPVAGDWGIPFGQVQWGRAPTVAILVSVGVGAEELRDDWVAVHELLHMVHPRFKGRPRWLSEGIATYYQEVARVRSGRIGEEEAREHMLWGVRQGRREARGRTLRQLSRGMRRTHAYRAVYWGGALMALDLDVAIRRVSGGERSLDTVLAALRGEAEVTLERFGREVDAQAGRPIYASKVQLHLDGAAFTRAEELFRRLGISDASPPMAPDARLLRAIFESP